MKIKFNDILMFVAFLLLIAVIIIIGTDNPGSNADLPTNNYVASVKCNMTEYNATITWDYYYLDESQSLEAYKFAVDYNCTFWHQRYELNKSEVKN